MTISLVGSRPPASLPRSNLRLLLADDCKVSRLVTHDVLQRLGIDATLVNNGEEAVKLAVERHFDLILMEIDMPVMDGIVATARIRDFEDLNPLRDRVPVVGYTAQERTRVEPVLLRVGMDAVLEKPCGILAMSVCLRRVCPGHFATGRR